MGIEGNYKEDDRTSAVAASIRGLGSAIDSGSGLAGSVIYGPPSLTRSRPNSGGGLPSNGIQLNGGCLLIDPANNYTSLTNDPSEYSFSFFLFCLLFFFVFFVVAFLRVSISRALTRLHTMLYIYTYIYTTLPFVIFICTSPTSIATQVSIPW